MFLTFVGAAVHYRPGLALGFGWGSIVSRTTNTKTHPPLRPDGNAQKTGSKSKSPPPKSVAIKTEADPLF